MQIKPVDGIYIKIAESVIRKCPACDERFSSKDGHQCDKSIYDTDWWATISEMFEESDRLYVAGDRKESERLFKTAHLLLDKRLPNPD